MILTFKINKQHVEIQSNKNYGICDVKIALRPEPQKPFKKEHLKKYFELKSKYDETVVKFKKIRQEILNKYQGRQINDDYIVESLYNTLSNLLK